MPLTKRQSQGFLICTDARARSSRYLVDWKACTTTCAPPPLSTESDLLGALRQSSLAARGESRQYPRNKAREIIDVPCYPSSLITVTELLPPSRTAISQYQPYLQTRFDVVQYILRLTNEYFEWHFRSCGDDAVLELGNWPSNLFSPQLLKTVTHASSFWKSVICGLDLLTAGESDQALLAFDHGCA